MKPKAHIAPEAKKIFFAGEISIRANPAIVPIELPKEAKAFALPNFPSDAISGISELLQIKAAVLNKLIKTFKPMIKSNDLLRGNKNNRIADVVPPVRMKIFLLPKSFCKLSLRAPVNTLVIAPVNATRLTSRETINGL